MTVCILFEVHMCVVHVHMYVCYVCRTTEETPTFQTQCRCYNNAIGILIIIRQPESEEENREEDEKVRNEFKKTAWFGSLHKTDWQERVAH